MSASHPKLVRDGVPDRVRAQGRTPVVRVCADDDEYRTLLSQKLAEECLEACEALLADDVLTPDGCIRLTNELADVFAVVWAVLAACGIDGARLGRAEQAKWEDRGGFDGRTVWEGG